MAKGKFHIGKKIKKEVRYQEYGITEFGHLLGLTRNVIYDIFEREHINARLLMKISKVLKHNFFKYYQEECERQLKSRKDL